MKNVRLGIASAVIRMGIHALVLTGLPVCSFYGVARAVEAPSGWTQHVSAANQTSRILAFASNKVRSAFGLLYSEADKEGAADQIRLMAFDGAGKLFKITNLSSANESAGKLVLHTKAGLTIDENAIAYVAMAAKSGVVRLSRFDLRRAAAPVVYSLHVGNDSAEVTKMVQTKRGELMLAGAVDGKGFVSSVTKFGVVNWTKYFDDGVVAILDLVEADLGFVLVGGIAGDQYFQGLWLGRMNNAGKITEKLIRQGPARFARLSLNSQKLGLIYEKLGANKESSTVLLDVFSRPTVFKDMKTLTLFEGRLATPFGLAGTNDDFAAAGVAGGSLHIYSVSSNLEIVQTFKGTITAPDYVRFHGAEIIGAPDARYLATLRSRADGRRQQLELVFSKIAGK